MSAFDHAVAPVLPILLAIAALGCLAGIVRAAAMLPLHVPLDPNEGWNAYHAAAAMSGYGLYPATGSFMINNYPPLSFYLVGLLGLLTGDQIVAGRIVALASFVCICGFAVLSVRRLGAGQQGALFSAVLLAATLFLTSDYVGMDDPQLLGHAFQLAALLLVLREPRTALRVFAASVLFVAGGFVKHNLFVLPLATGLWLALFDRRNAIRLALYGIGLAVCGLVMIRLLFGFNLLGRLASARLWSFVQFVDSFATWLPFVLVPLLGLAALVIWRPKNSSPIFVAIYAALAVAAGAFMAGGAGVDVNAMFDADIALALGAGLVLARMLEEHAPLPHLLGLTFALAALTPFAALAAQSPDWREASFWLHPMRDETALAARDIKFLRAHPGPAICESLAFCYWAGKQDPVDVFNLDQQIRTGAHDPEPLLRAISAHHFAAIELDETDPFPLPRTVQSAILYNYRIDHTNDEGTFLLPR
ncbi:MAG TPA: glycosyltransferase family 39 protein [Rhizomicrobium sp.]|nr:glycosyltransferase family 39 protein [Rhizomicrobium sp.]